MTVATPCYLDSFHLDWRSMTNRYYIIAPKAEIDKHPNLFISQNAFLISATVGWVCHCLYQHESHPAETHNRNDISANIAHSVWCCCFFHKIFFWGYKIKNLFRKVLLYNTMTYSEWVPLKKKEKRTKWLNQCSLISDLKTNEKRS